MKKAKIFASGAMKIGEVSPALFGSFVEHLGRCVYTGIFEPGHETADAEGFREDVLELVRGLGISNVRYPGGNFLSGYNWRDGIGRKENRPVRLDLAWETIETNQFGTDEFVSWCRKAGAEPMIGVNMGTGSPKDAAELVEYCNHPGGTYLSDMRAENGYREPHGIKTWCLGNEMDGPWQICSLTAEDYGKKALAAARMMRMVDPSIKLVACGSSSAEMETFPDWDRHILETLYDEADYISIHQYYWPRWEEADYLASYLEMDNYIKDVKATIDYVKAKRRSRKRMAISFDEWNIWYQRRQWESGWKAAPRKLEDIYSYTDALVFSGLLNTLINNCDIVKFACLAQLVNVIAPIFTEPGGSAVKQTIYYPFELASRYGRGTALNLSVDCPGFENRHGTADYISASAVQTAEGGLTVFLTNYDTEAYDLELELHRLDYPKAVESIVIAEGKPEPQANNLPIANNGSVRLELAPNSYSMIRLAR